MPINEKGWKERPVDLLAQAQEEVGGQRRREIAGRKAPGPSKPGPNASGRGPFLTKDPKNYPTYPKSGTFRYSGLAKGYMYRWNLFLTGKTDEVPPSFEDYRKQPEEALKDTRKVEEAFRTGSEIQRGSSPTGTRLGCTRSICERSRNEKR